MSRLNEGLLQPLERPALQWLARRVPAYVTPDMLTTVGFVGAILCCIGYWFSATNPWMLVVASLGLVINWFGDSLDGTVARYRKIERPTYGFFVDHTTDVFEQVIVAIAIGLSGWILFELSILALIVYLLFSVLTFARAQYLNSLQISYAGFGPTELRLALIAMNFGILVVPPQPFDVLGLTTTWPNCLSVFWSTVGSAVLITQVWRTARELKATSLDQAG